MSGKKRRGSGVVTVFTSMVMLLSLLVIVGMTFMGTSSTWRVLLVDSVCVILIGGSVFLQVKAGR